ncbi:MAG: DUF2541 family protein [Bacteroidetes bacterium]|nr:DUF2541 family protein [Bacteroidota bacterium]
MKKLIIILMAITAGYSNMSAQKKGKGEKEVNVITSDKTGWHKIGEMVASFSKERDVMTVVGADKFAAIKIKVTDADIHISDIEVYYENGTQEDINVKSNIKNGGESRVIDLKGGERSIKRIAFVYKTAGGSTEKAHLEVWGLKTNAKK